MKKLVFLTNWVQGRERSLTGGDRIWIELAKRWQKKIRLTIIGSQEALKIARYYLKDDIKLYVSSNNISDGNYLFVGNLIKNTLKRVIEGIVFLLKYSQNNKIDFLYTASDFPAESLPAFFLKLLKPKVIWIAGFYLFASPFWEKDSPYKGKAFVRGFVYWLGQIFTYFIIKNFADFVFVTSEPDVKKFITKRRTEDKVVVVRGGVDVSESKKYLKTKNRFLSEKKYLACFVGRFHCQKGVLELLDIWRKVVESKKDAKLALVGNGALEKEIAGKIKKYNLEGNIDMLGFKDGKEKNEVFKNSKMIVHPAIFDSGGMAAAEGMAWGLPGVSFDLESLKTYYPKGVVKTPCFDLEKFAQNIIKLAESKTFFVQISRQAVALINSEWDWDKRAGNIYQKVFLKSQNDNFKNPPKN